jgi:hypothetical protein
MTRRRATAASLLTRVKANLIIEHDLDDILITDYIESAFSYAEQYQHKPDGYYSKADAVIVPTTEQGIVMLASHWYESRDGSGGLFPDSGRASTQAQAMTAVNRLLQLDRSLFI